MLSELRIRNVAIIEEVRVELASGLNIISGETGAGKSIILDCLGLLLGGRAENGLIRRGEDQAVIEGLFDLHNFPHLQEELEKFGLEVDSEVAIRRLLRRSGRGRIHVNGSPVTLGTLKKIGLLLADLSGQHEQQHLLDASKHLLIVDEFGVDQSLKAAMKSRSQALAEAQRRLKTILDQQKDKAEREAFLQFQLEEFERIAPLPDEDQTLEAERSRLLHAEKLFESAKKGEERLYSGEAAVVEGLGSTLEYARQIADIDQTMVPLVESLESCLFQLEDAARSFSTYQRTIEFNPARLNALHERLDELSELKRKHRLDLAGVMEKAKEMADELETLQNLEQQTEDLEAEVINCWNEALKASQALTAARRQAGDSLQSLVETQLASLNMAKASFQVAISDKNRFRMNEPEGSIGPDGNDRLEFYLSANPGEPAGPLKKVASGGELSRVLLALKCVVAGFGVVSTFIFDEIDTGIGGATAEVVGQKLSEIASQRQVISITHLPQIAAYGQRHINVVKEVRGERTRTQVESLGLQARIEELARMLGGLEVTERTREHARELIARGQDFSPG